MINRINIFNFYKKRINSFLNFLSRFTFVSIICFSIDTLLFINLRSEIGTNKALIISFFVSQTLLFILLKTLLIKKFKREINGYLIQIAIGIGSLIIHFSILNIIDYFTLIFFPNFYLDVFLDSKIISLFLKLTCGAFGFLWSSILSKKLLYKSKKK